MAKPRSIAIVSDAWFPQVNGVVRTLSEVRGQLEGFGHRVHMLTPDRFATIPCPTYAEIRLAVNAWPKLGHMLEALDPDAIHIATEGPLGWAARRYCLKRSIPFTTAFHTKFAEYVEQRFRLPARYGYALLRRFHRPSSAMMVATPSLERALQSHGFTNTQPWTRGVDTVLFHPDKREDLGYQGPVMTYVGRVAVEKNLEAFLSLNLPGTTLVVGDGPARTELETRFPHAVFVGAQHGEALARYYASSDVFVFPSRTDTFGLVMLEALASGTAVAAYPVTGPMDVITDPNAGCLHEDLETAIVTALTLSRESARRYALHYSWEQCARLLESALAFRPSA